MKIIDAYWEKRNLGVDTKEIIVSDADSMSDLVESIQSFPNQSQLYLVVKIPTGIPKYIQFLSEQGFCFVESLFEVSLNMKNAHIPEILIKFDNLLSYRQLNDKTEIGRLENEIKKGIFISDRIALNSQFGIEKAAVRYMNWINDEVVKGAKVFEIIYKTTPIGFFTLKCLAENKYDNFLAGMYVNQENFGYGFSILSKSIEEVKKQHGKSITTHISSNNIEVMRLYFQFGFVPTDVVYVMSKISKINDK